MPHSELVYSIKSRQRDFSQPSPDLCVAVWSRFRGTGLEFNIQHNCVRNIRRPATSWLISRRLYTDVEHHLHARVVKKSEMDWELVNGWIRHCRANHSTSCGRRLPLSLPGFQVIDCSSRKIVQLPENLQFVALSYCWGHSKEAPKFTLRLPARTSSVVEDAIVVTRKIGLQYLWVDRHCIDQSDPETKHTLIQRMDQIYHNAAVTIIDAAGADPRYGLPGVTKTGRRPQDTVYDKRHKLVSIPNMKEVIASSRWGRRGWTYQEGLLSRRRLVFTETQIYFQCLEQHFCESHFVPVGDIGRTYQHEIKGLMNHTQAFPPQGAGTLHDHIYKRIREYLSRQLSHDSDILYAFTGILQHFVRRDKPVYHIWGVPFTSTISVSSKDSVQDQFLKSLLWLPSDDWKGAKLSRRVDFPSWSWTGWRGLAGIQPGHEVAKTCVVVKDVEIRITQKGDDPLSVAQYVAQIHAEDCSTQQYSTGLHLTGWVTYVRLTQYFQLSRSNSDLSDRGSKSDVDVSDESGHHRLCQAHVMTHQVDGRQIPSSDYLYNRVWPVLLYFGYSGVMHGLILRQVGETVYEKLGVIPYLKVDPRLDAPPQDSQHRYLTKRDYRDYGPSHKPLSLRCERKSIVLR